MSKILVTGATGFVGKRLILALLAAGHQVYANCRIKGSPIFTEEKSHLFYVWGDLRNSETFATVPEDIDAAYYLVHSMSGVVANLSSAEEEVANSFVKGMEQKKIRQLIYLGGIINDEHALSPHLGSRLKVENILTHSAIPTTILRASIIIGAGSASFEIIRDLCEKLPIMIAPKWVNSQCQPIAISDVLFYLEQVLLKEECYNKIFDIGGPEVLSFKQLMQNYSSFRGLKTKIFEVPFLTPRLSSFWLFFITSVRFSICYYLVESMKSNTVVKLGNIMELFPHTCLNYQQSLQSAFDNISNNGVESTWMDSWETNELNPNIEEYLKIAEKGDSLKDQQRVPITASKEIVIDRIFRIGGKTGYYAFDWAWNLRGLLDKMVGGIGLNRGRRDTSNIQVGESIDFWRVLVADKQKGHLVLFSSMKVPGNAWLTFQLTEEEEKIFLVQTAIFQPRGLWGRLYWCLLFPIHFFLFKSMAKNIAKA